MAGDEEVFCLLRGDLSHLFGGELPQGAFAGPAPESLLALPQHFLPRSVAEHDPDFKQLIPYQLFCWANRFFVYQRGGGVGEERLAGRFSLGIGGHINSVDAEEGVLTASAYHAALARERQEELVCAPGLTSRFLGWINDDSDPVGQVHLGAVHLSRVIDREMVRLRPHGEDLHDRGWWSGEEIRTRGERFEKWSLLACQLAESFTQ
ncbi:MAG: phosphoesterase [Thermodesulfobacteriota bacterium]